jgi:electron transport complex protein RnfE
MREIIGQGTLFSGLASLAGAPVDQLTIRLPFQGLLLALLPPGAFLCFAVLLATVNWITGRGAAVSRAATTAPVAERVGQ